MCKWFEIEEVKTQNFHGNLMQYLLGLSYKQIKKDNNGTFVKHLKHEVNIRQNNHVTRFLLKKNIYH